jgi:hypothetical protein
MVHVVLDTNIFSSNRRRDSGPFHALVRLCNGSKVTLHVPYVVKQEFLSQQQELACKHFGDIRVSASKLRDITRQGNIVEFAKKIEPSAGSLENVANLVEKEWQHWLKSVSAVEDPIGSSHGQRVIDDYFVGKPPFKTPKNRNDIPDSYVWQAVLDLTKQFQPLHFVASDKAMFDAATKIQEIVAFEKLGAFIETKECQDGLREMAEEVLTQNVRRAGNQLREVREHLEWLVGLMILNALDGETITDGRIHDDNHEATIYSIDDPQKMKFAFDKVEYYGSSEIGVPFEVVTECRLHYAIYKADYYVLDEDEQAKISISELNDHYYDAEGDYDIKVTGTLQAKLDEKKLLNEKIKNAELRELLENTEYKLNIDETKIA